LPIELATTLVDKLLPEIGALIIPVDGAIALDAFARFGKGRRPAALNMGDCFAYACAKARGQPLRCKSDDFGRTDALLA
jgi:ribonuclease VapC